MVALTIPSNEYRMSARGEAAHARAMPCLRFFLTLLARPFVLRGFAFIYDKLSETIRSTSETDASAGLNSAGGKTLNIICNIGFFLIQIIIGLCFTNGCL